MTGDLPLERELSSLADEELLLLSLSDPKYFEPIVERYQDAFLRKAQSIIPVREDAEDIVQETFAKIYLHGGRFQKVEGASFKSWGYKILVNTALTRYKKRKREVGTREPLDPEMYEKLPDTSERAYERHEVSDYVVYLLSGLPEQLSRPLKLHFLEGKSQKEIGEELGLSTGAVKTRIHRAKQEMKKRESQTVDNSITP